MMTTSEIEQWLRHRPDIESVFACVCDLNGTLRGKRLPVAQALKVGSNGLRMPLSVICVDIWGEDIQNSELVFGSGDADGLCDATERGILPISWTDKPSAMIQVWMREEGGSPFVGDPRRALADIVSRYSQRGLRPVVATELEFYLVDARGKRPRPPVSPVSGRRLANDGVLSLDELQEFEGFLNDVYAACEAQGIQVDTAIAENGAGQFEINMVHTDDPLQAADDAVLFKRLVRGIARRHGFAASFMAKPYGNRAGSGFHVHFSLIDEHGENVFDDGGAAGSPIMLHAIGGLLESMQETALTFAPHANSYRRLLPGSHAPTGVAWGYENRTTAIRIPGGNPKARRIEHRVAGADANPYLVLGSILGAALSGIETARNPAPPITGDAYAHELQQLPASWTEAIDAFDAGTHVAEIYSARLQRLFTGTKRQELMRFAREVTDFEYATYLEAV